jgi:aspartyl protease family protein
MSAARGQKRAMLRSVIVLAVIACVAGLYAPSVFPALFQAASGAASNPTAPTQAMAPVTSPPSPVVQASASDEDSGRMVRLDPDMGGQYSTEVVINGSRVRMLVDTGATYVSLSAETAQRIGLSVTDSNYTARMTTANGIARAAPVTLNAVSVGDIYVPTVQGIVMDRQAGGVNLLGMSFLKRLSRVEQKSGQLILRQ